MRTLFPRALEPGVGEPDAGERAARQVDPGEAGVAEVGPVQPGTRELGVGGSRGSSSLKAFSSQP